MLLRNALRLALKCGLDWIAEQSQIWLRGATRSPNPETMMLSMIKYAALFALSVTALEAQAAVTVYSATLNGASEVPSNGSTAIGNATVTVDDVANTLVINETFGGLGSITSGAHIHCCAGPAATAAIAVGFPTFPGGVTSGTFNGSFNLLNMSTYTSAFLSAAGGTAIGARDALIAGLNGGLAYANIHTAAFPAGEIRGQLSAGVPEPASWAMIIVGFGLIGGAVRHRERVRLVREVID